MVKVLIIWSLVTVVMFSQTSVANIMQSAKYISKACDHPSSGKKTAKETSCCEKETMSFEAPELTVQQNFPELIPLNITLTPALQEYSFYTLLFSNPHWKPPAFSI